MDKRSSSLGVILLLLCSMACIQLPKGAKEAEVNFLSDYTRHFVSIDKPNLALIHAKLIDGKGTPPKEAQSILIKNGWIEKIGHSDSIQIPIDYFSLDLSGKTLIPGIIGTHNHMRLPRAAMLATSPKLSLACGVTTIQTCGTGNPREEIAIARSINKGEQPGPEIINSSPYFTGAEGKSNFIRFTDEKTIRDTIAYWANQGVKWLKVYRHTSPEDLRIIIDEAHIQGLKVSGHLCATTYKEAAILGIDAIEHGFIHSYDHAIGKEVGTCSGSRDFRTNLDINDPALKEVQRILIEKGVALSTTPAIFEAQARGLADARDLKALSTFHVDAYKERRERMIKQGEDWYFKESWLTKSLQYDLQFFSAGGLLTAGPDPGLHNLPGYGDQKNYELFIEGGFRVEEAIQVMTYNGAKLLGREDIGSIEVGKRANLVILDGDLIEDPSIIRAVETVFKDGIGYDPEKLIKAVKGNVGSSTDNSMAYFGQRVPGDKAEVFAPNLISLAGRNESACTFSQDGKEFFFKVSEGNSEDVFYSQLKEGVWTPFKRLHQEPRFVTKDTLFSPDKSFKIFEYQKKGEFENGDLYLSFLDEEGNWSTSISLEELNTENHECCPFLTNDGKFIFFSSNEDLYWVSAKLIEKYRK